MDRALRAVGEDRRAGLGPERTREGLAVEGGDVAVEDRALQRPHPPAGVLHLVFHAAAAAQRGVAPVVLGDELLLRARRRFLRHTGNHGADSIPGSPESPAPPAVRYVHAA